MKKNQWILLLVLFIVLSGFPYLSTANTAPAEDEYAWVLVEILDFENAEGWETADSHESSSYSHSYSRGNYIASVTYEGKDYDGRGLAGTLASQAVFSGMPDVIYPDKPVTLKLSFFKTKDDTVKIAFGSVAMADFDRWDTTGITSMNRAFVNANGENAFRIISSDPNRPSSYNETLTASLGTGSEGDRMALRTKFTLQGVPMSTHYVYEWKRADSAPAEIKPVEKKPKKYWKEPVYKRPPPHPEIFQLKCVLGDVHGDVNVRQDDEDDDAYIFAWGGMELYHNDRVKTLRRSGAIISFGDMSTYVMKEDTTIVLDLEIKERSKLYLVTGRMWTNLTRMVEGLPAEVELSQAIAGARGTTFICEEIDGISTVKVFEGTVEVTSKVTGDSVMVGGGEMYRIDGSGQGTLTTFDTKAELADWDEKVQKITA
ncbi:MAG: FecR family protein, partial [Methanimicrococcus sp.]|nr:FecR family protein [Methanimicrococcus sp.]